MEGALEENPLLVAVQALLQNQQVTQEMLHMIGQQVHQNVAGAGTLRASTLRFMQVPTFGGDQDKQNLDTWLFQVEQFCDAAGIADQGERVLLAAMRLTGHAAAWWRDLCQVPDQRPTQWQQFRDRITAMYQPVSRAQLARDKLAKAMQIRSLEQYITYMRELFFAIPGITEDEKMDRFKRGLNRYLFERVAVHLPRPNTLEEMISIAVMHESLRRGADHLPQRHHDRQRAGGNDNGPAPMELGATDRRARPKTGRCYNCGKKGHYARECRAPKKDQGKEQSQQGQPPTT